MVANKHMENSMSTTPENRSSMPMAEVSSTTRYLEVFAAVLSTHTLSWSVAQGAGCGGCEWTHRAADEATAQRLHAVHVMAVLRENNIAVEVMGGAVAESDSLGHFDRIADTGVGFSRVGNRFVVECAWCSKTFLGDTREQAEERYRSHEDTLRVADKAERGWAETGIGGYQRRLYATLWPRDYWPRNELAAQ